MFASYMGAWIEIEDELKKHKKGKFASYMGAWIEIMDEEPAEDENEFASYMGAWIEIIKRGNWELKVSSHPIWVRGLKS